MAGMRFKFTDYAPKINAQMVKAAKQWLEEAGNEVESQVKRNTRVATGKTKGSFSHKVSGEVCSVGSNYENAIWEEYGTGIYAEQGGRTKVPWTYQDANGDWHKTKGKRGTRALRKAFTSTRPKIKARAEQIFSQIGGE